MTHPSKPSAGADHDPVDVKPSDILRAMERASNTFYANAFNSGMGHHCHAFIEFTGLMNEFIVLCRQAHARGIAFGDANTHTERPLPIEVHQAAYLAEKFDCIFGPSLRANPEALSVFLQTLKGESSADAKVWKVGDAATAHVMDRGKPSGVVCRLREQLGDGWWRGDFDHVMHETWLRPYDHLMKPVAATASTRVWKSGDTAKVHVREGGRADVAHLTLREKLSGVDGWWIGSFDLVVHETWLIPREAGDPPAPGPNFGSTLPLDQLREPAKASGTAGPPGLAGPHARSRTFPSSQIALDIEAARDWRARAESAEEKVKLLYAEYKQLKRMAETYYKAQEILAEAEKGLALAKTPTEGVWRWLGDGTDNPESIACPVVMSAETLRGLVVHGGKPSRGHSFAVRAALPGGVTMEMEQAASEAFSKFGNKHTYAEKIQSAIDAALAAGNFIVLDQNDAIVRITHAEKRGGLVVDVSASYALGNAGKDGSWHSRWSRTLWKNADGWHYGSPPPSDVESIYFIDPKDLDQAIAEIERRRKMLAEEPSASPAPSEKGDPT